MVLKQAVDPVMEPLVAAWHDAETIRDMPELFTEDKLAQIANATMAAIEAAWARAERSLQAFASRRQTRELGRQEARDARVSIRGHPSETPRNPDSMPRCAGARWILRPRLG